MSHLVVCSLPVSYGCLLTLELDSSPATRKSLFMITCISATSPAHKVILKLDPTIEYKDLESKWYSQNGTLE